jgi:serine/threonine protein kinase
MSQSTVIRAGYEPIPGYAGGYGEVWSADAPGGLQKAVKLVYGTLDEQRASSELRSLQRIRQVHHPLLLSIERIEIVNGQLIIVTELAESSLIDFYHASRRRQLQGIPRDQLLDFLRDAADALDYLSQKHDLQHLDVKPGNLLLMADRIKVADFGLIKDLHDPNVSIVSGLTPSHAAPELFDGRPDRLSDLYSLAVVYQEMLTGQLPFDGKTPGELARQHLHQPPNLEPLPPADRRVVARALAKHPLDRYPSCRAFVEELRNSGVHEKYAAKSRSAESQNESRSETFIAESPKSTSTCTSPALLGGLQILPPLPTADSAEGWQAPLCMFIGLGGMGCRAMTSLRSLLEQKVDSRRRPSDHQWLAIDTDFDLLSEVCSAGHAGAFEYSNVCHIKLLRPQDYRERHDDRFGAISRRWLYNIPRSLKTEGVRPLGMLALVDNFEEVDRRIYEQLKTLLGTRQTLEGIDCQPIRIYICNSLHGGTGSAVTANIGRMVRSALAQLGCTDYFLTATLSIAMTTGIGGGLPAAAALATLCELDAQMDGSNFIPAIGFQPSTKGSVSAKPFDWVTMIDGGLYGSADEVTRTTDALAEALWVDSHTLVGPTLDAARHPQGPQYKSVQRGWLRAARSSLVQLGTKLSPAQVARISCARAIQRWHACVTSGVQAQEGQDLHGQLVGWSPAQTASIIEHLSSECLRVLRLTGECTAAPGEAEAGPNPWRNRASQSPEAVRMQVERDIRACRQWYSTQMRPSYISWKMLQRVVLRTVERMLEMASEPDDALRARVCDRQADQEPFTAEELKTIRQTIQQLADKCVQQLQWAQPQIEQFADMMGNWANSLQAEHKMRDGVTGIDLASSRLPSGWGQLLVRVDAVLDKSLHRFVVGRCFNSSGSEATNQETLGGLLSLEHLLQLSDDLATRLMREAGIQSAIAETESSGSGSTARSVVLQDVEAMIPSAAQRGGRLHRLLAVTPAQLNDIQERLTQLELDSSCTIVPAQFGDVPVAVCDANALNLSGVINAFWRPNADTFHLAERLHTRCDVAWPQIDTLFATTTAECVG